MPSAGGWAVPQATGGRPSRLPSTDIIKNKLDTFLTEGKDYRIELHGYYDRWCGKKLKYALKRIIFTTDEAFIMAKMVL